MATGDTIPGGIRVMRVTAEGSTERIFGPEPQDRVDYVNGSSSAEEKLYINTAISDRMKKPSGAESKTVPDAQWGPGETILIQHRADSTVANDIDVDLAGAFAISGVETDMNRNTKYPNTLRSGDNSVSNDVAEATDDWVTFFKYTVGDRKKFNMAGPFGVSAVEN